MNIRRLITILLLLVPSVMPEGPLDFISSTAVCQTEMETPKKPRPKRKDQSHFILKMNYYTPNLKLKDNFTTDLNMGKIAGVASHSSLGFGLYIPLGQYFFLQPEALFSLVTDWEAASYEGSVVKEFGYGFKHRYGTAMDVPLLLGVKWAPSKMFRAKAFLGPTFNLGWIQKDFQSKFNPYTLTLGAGLDLLNFIDVDMGYQVLMDGMSYARHSQWFVSVGIIM